MTQDAQRPTTVPVVTVDEAHALVAGGTVQVIDVRAVGDYAAAHLPGAVNLPLEALAERVADVPRDRPVLLVCGGGGRSGKACALLLARGLDNVVSVDGGTRGWIARGYPVERAAAQATEGGAAKTA